MFVSNAHQLVVLFQTIEKDYRVVTYFYGLLEIYYDESAQGLLDLLVSDFDRNGILDKIKKNLGNNYLYNLKIPGSLFLINMFLILQFHMLVMVQGI